MATPSAFSWNSELPSGRNPFWIRDEGLAGLGLHVGDAVSVDTRGEPSPGDLVVVDVELEDDSLRTARRYVPLADDQVRLEPVGGPADMVALQVPAESMMIMGVIAARLRISDGSPIEEPLRPAP